MSFARTFFLCLALVCIGCQTVTQDHLRTFQEAQSAFDSENYRQSATLYEKLIEQGVRTGTVYYNLGNAWAKAEDPIRAVAAYYLAKRYVPNDPHLNANLRTILAKKGGTQPLSSHSPINLVFFWQDSVGYNTKIWCSLIIVVSTFFVSVLCLFRKSKWAKRCTVAGVILTVIALCSAGYDWYRYECVKQIIVTESVLPRKGNSEQYEAAFTSPIPFGTLAAILDKRSGWVLLRFPNGQEGWLSEEQVFRLQ